MTGQTGSGGAPTGAAGGVLSGSYPSPAFATNGADALLSSRTAVLAADVTMTNVNQWYDGPSVALSAGTWLIVGTITVRTSGVGGGTLAVRLWDGTTTYASANVGVSATGDVSLSLSALAVITGTPTLRIAAFENQAGAIIRAATFVGAVGNVATQVTALRVA